MPIGLGSTFLNREAQNLPSHLWVVISKPDSSGQVAIANLTSCRGTDDDCGCFCDRGDHPFVHHKSYVNYACIKVVTLAKLNELLKKDLIELHADASDDFLDRIWEGSTRSRFTRNEIIDLLRSQDLI